MRLHVRLFLISALICQTALAQMRVGTGASWPRPVPARIHDGGDRDLFVMTLGDVNTVLADGAVDPARDEVGLKGGSVVQKYFKGKLGVEDFRPVDKSRVPLP